MQFRKVQPDPSFGCHQVDVAGVVFQRTIQRESRPVISVDLPLRPDHPNGNSPFNLVPNDLPMGPSRIHGAQCTLLVLDEVIDFRHVVVVRIGRGLELLIPFVGPFLRLDVVNHRPASVDVIAQTRVKRTQAAQQAFVHVDGVRRISRSREHLLMIPAELDPTFKEASEDLGKPDYPAKPSRVSSRYGSGGVWAAAWMRRGIRSCSLKRRLNR